MNFGQAIVSGFKNYANGQGRSSRSEYWYWTLFTVLVGLAFGILEETLGGQRAGLGLGVRIVQLVFDFAIFLPTLAVGIRRLHDTGLSGWWVLLGWLMIVWLCKPGLPGANRYGRNPLEPEIEAVFA